MRRFTRLFPVLLLVVGAALVWAHSAGPPNGVSGAPGEGTCADAGCHDDHPVYPGGAVTVEAPNRYMYGDTLNLRVELASVPDQMRRGFELTVLDTRQQPAGNLIVSDPVNTQLSMAPGGRAYLKHTVAGSASPDSLMTHWNFRWEAPPNPIGAVIFYVAACGADGDSTVGGDWVSTWAEWVIDNTDCFLRTGDVNEDGRIASADIVYLVNSVIRLGPKPQPCEMVGDVNCNGSITTSDIIELVGVVFKGETLWCNVCNLWVDGRWRCPLLDGG